MHRTKGTIDYIHSDLWSLTPIIYKGSSRYLLTFIDHSEKVRVYFLKHKNEVFGIFKKWKTLLEKQTGKPVKWFKIDNGLEFYSIKFNDFCKQEGIEIHHIIIGTLQQNGVTKQMNKTLLDKARYKFSKVSLEKEFWAEVLNLASYLVNQSPHRALDGKVLEEILSGNPPSYSNISIRFVLLTLELVR